jgi:hypothetical protein
MEAGMTMHNAKDTYGYLGTEAQSLREQLDRLTAAIEQAAKIEGADAVKVAGEAAREIVARALAMADEVSGKAKAAAAAAGEGRQQLEGAIRDKPLVAVSLAVLAGFLLAKLVRR